MGQGYSLTTLSAGSAGIDVPELSDFTYERSLGDARFMKAVRARHRQGVLVLKVAVKPSAETELSGYVKEIMRERKLLADIPNALAYHQTLETSTNAYLLRQYIHSSVYDRMSTRPFLEDVEKRWLAFQLLNAVRDCHSKSVFHGDIKTENALVTSWNWLYLSDFSSSFKPTYLPEDNPATFFYYFDISGRRTCYLAPERFLKAGERFDSPNGVTWAMDIFSVGCVIAEIFLETPIFTLSQLLGYRRNDYDPATGLLNKIEDEEIRDMVLHMIQIEPESRYSADEYLNFWRRKAFPEYFYSFLHQYMQLITDSGHNRGLANNDRDHFGDSDDRIERVFSDFDKIAYFLGYYPEEGQRLKHQTSLSFNRLFPLQLDLPNKRQIQDSTIAPLSDDGTLLFLNIVTSAIRSTARSAARIKACELILAFAEKLTDEAKLDRALPYVIALISSQNTKESSKDRLEPEIVIVAALRTLTQLVSMVSTASPVNAYLFPQYLLPNLRLFIVPSANRVGPLVRATYASCIATLADTASRFLDVVQALKAEGSIPTVEPANEDTPVTAANSYDLYDETKSQLVQFFETQSKTLLTDNSPEVRRAFLSSVPNLCIFFGSEKANDVILSHLNTYLNDRDWKLKAAFFETIVGVAVYVGGPSLEEFILPLMIPALTDPEEFVVEKALRSLSSMAALGLFQKPVVWRLLELIVRFTMHPNSWIREAAVYFIQSSSRHLSTADRHCILLPVVHPYLRVKLNSTTEAALLDTLKKPLARPVLEMAITWASKAEKGAFWKPVQQRLSLNIMDERVPLSPAEDLTPNALSRACKTEEDQQWLSRLRHAGLSSEDEFKLLVLRGYVWHVSRQRRDISMAKTVDLDRMVALKDVGVSLKTVFFNHQENFDHQNLAEQEPWKPNQTIADALLDASNAVDESIKNSRATSPKPSTETRDQISNQRTELEGFDKTRALNYSPTKHDVDKPNIHISAMTKANPGNPQQVNNDLGVRFEDQGTRRTNSAISLIQRPSNLYKADAQIGTSSANAFGKVDGYLARDSEPNTNISNQLELVNKERKGFTFRGLGYSGNDPSVIKFLDSMALENYPVDDIEFGPAAIPVRQRLWEKKSNTSMLTSWKPDGNLVAAFGEHKAAVNRVLVSADHAFFITASDDGTVRVWDTSRLEQNLANRSRQVYRQSHDAKINDICFIDNTHSFACACSDGSVDVVKVETKGSQQGALKYQKLRVLRHWELSEAGSHAVWIEHYKVEHESVLVLATNKSEIKAVDLKTMNTLYTLQNPVAHGVPTCFCLGKAKHWLLLGTQHGIIDLWDLRFGLRLRSWAFAGGVPIYRITLSNQKFEDHKICVTIVGGVGTEEITVWDLEKPVCLAAYRNTPHASLTINRRPETTTAASRGSSSTPSAAEKDGKLKEPTYAVTELVTSLDDPLLTDYSMSYTPPSLVTKLAPVRSIYPCSLYSDVNQDSRPRPILLAAGGGRKVRFWDLVRPNRSCVVSGLEAEEDQPVYRKYEGPIAGSTSGGPLVWEEVDSAMIEEDVGQRKADETNKSKRATSYAGAAGGAKTEKGKAKTTLVSLQQQKLLRSHLDVVTDVALLEYPFRMIVSVDRSGLVLVFS